MARSHIADRGESSVGGAPATEESRLSSISALTQKLSLAMYARKPYIKHMKARDTRGSPGPPVMGSLKHSLKSRGDYLRKIPGLISELHKCMNRTAFPQTHINTYTHTRMHANYTNTHNVFLIA